jgi:hypothetical protein
MSEGSPQGSNALDWRVRHAVYRHFASTGRAPSVAELADTVEQPATAVEDALRRLADAHHAIALAPGATNVATNVWMAWPFSSVPTAYPVHTAERRYWANCAWDALGIPALVGLDATTTTRCPDCAAELTLAIKGGELAAADAATDTVVHFAVPPRRWYDNVAFT